MATNIAIIYADGSKVIRRIISAESDGQLNSALVNATIPGESILLLPFDSYSKANAIEVRDMVAAQIGPAGTDKCIEHDANGVIVARYHADPVLDPVTMGKANTMVLSDVGDIGDIKLFSTGEIVSMKPAVVPDKAAVVAKLKAIGGLSDAAASVQADAIVAQQTQAASDLAAKQAAALAQGAKLADPIVASDVIAP